MAMYLLKKYGYLPDKLEKAHYALWLKYFGIVRQLISYLMAGKSEMLTFNVFFFAGFL